MKNYIWGGSKRFGNHDEDEDETSGHNLILDVTSSVEVVENTIYYYTPVTQESVLALVQRLKEMDKEHQKLAIDYDLASPPPIHLHIHSYGGSVFAGFAAMDAIRNCVTPVHTHIEGCAASAATLISVAGDHRTMGANSYLLIHQIFSMFWGKYDEWKDEMINQEALMQKIMEIYLEHTEIEEDDLEEILKKDLWFDTDTSLGYGLVDEVK